MSAERPGALVEALLELLRSAAGGAAAAGVVGPELLRARSEALAALAAPPGEASAGTLERARARLEAVAAESSAAEGAEPAPGARAQRLAREIAAHATRQQALLALPGLLEEPDLRAEEREVLEEALGRIGAVEDAQPDAEPQAALDERAVRALLGERRERARARLQAALGEAQEAGVELDGLTSAADPWAGAERGCRRLHAAAAFVETRIAERRMQALLPRLEAALAAAEARLAAAPKGAGRAALEAALADLRTRTAGEAPGETARALAEVERLLGGLGSGGARREREAPPAIDAQDVAALREAHPLAARIADELAARAAAGGRRAERDLLEQAALEARALRQAMRSTIRGHA